MDIQSPVASYPPRGTDPVGSVAAAQPLPAVSLPAAPLAEPLGPAATVDLSDEGREAAERPAADAKATGTDQSERRFSVDPDTRQIVFQVYDPASNTVLDQLPDESALRARAYAREMTAQGNTQTVDRTA
jgi:hypothetical protein